jgi:hypothetical protein
MNIQQLFKNCITTLNTLEKTYNCAILNKCSHRVGRRPVNKLVIFLQGCQAIILIFMVGALVL